jgi:hypothetical protein
MAAPRSEFTDDSSKSLGLSHAATGVPDPQVFDRGGDRLPKPGKLRDMEIADRERILAGERTVRDAEIAKLVAQGATAKQAAEIFERERGKHGKERKALERAERRLKATEIDMGVHKKPAKHSGSKSGRRFGSPKKGTWICSSCRLEGCEHRPKSRGGRPATSNRSLETHIRMSPLTKAAMRQARVKPSDAAEIFAIAWRDGTTVAAAAEVFRSRKGVEQQSAA